MGARPKTNRTQGELFMIRLVTSIACLVLCSATLAATARNDLSTIAERSKYQRTGRYEEVEQLCHAFQQQWPQQVRCFEFGRSPEGRTMWALAASGDGTLDPQTARSRQRPVALMQGG